MQDISFVELDFLALNDFDSKYHSERIGKLIIVRVLVSIFVLSVVCT